VLTTLGRRTDESGCGSWPTIRASDAVHGGVTQQGNGQGAESLTSLAAKWQTPSATCADAGATSRSGDRKGELLLGGQARQWSTPREADSRGITTSESAMANPAERVGPSLLQQAEGLTGNPHSWATPIVRDWRGGKVSPETMERNARPLNEQVTNWPIPRTTDVNAGRGCVQIGNCLYRPSTHLDNGELVGANLVDAAGQPDPASPSTNGKLRGSLNSAWVAQLMSWPDEYMLALTELVTEYHLTKPRPQRTKACSG